MALTQEQVDWWFDQNPNATADQVAAAVQGAGGLEANTGLADMIANRYDIDTKQVTDYYTTYTAPASGGITGLPTTGGTNVVDTTGIATIPTVGPTVTTQPTVSTTVTTLPTVTTSPTTVTTSPTTASLTPTTTIYGRQEVDALDVPGYGVIAQTELQGWEPWRLQMWGITKNADGNFAYSGGPAWTTATGTTKTLYDQINNISNLQGMGGLYTGGALDTSEDGLGSKEAVLWDFTNKLTAAGITSLADIGRRTVTRQIETEQGTQTVEEEEIYNKKTGQALYIEGTTLGNHQTNYGFTFTNTGLAIPTTSGTQSEWVEFRESVLPIVLTAVSLAYPQAAPYIQAFNAAKAAKDGKWMQAALSGLSAASGLAGSTMVEIDALANAGKFEQALDLYNSSWLAQNAGNIAIAKDVAGVVNAATNNDVIGLVNAGVKFAGATLPAELRTGVNILNLGNAINNNDTTGILNAAGDLTKSNDLKLAAAASNYINAINNFDKTGDVSGIANATTSFSNFLQNYSNNSTTTATTTPTTNASTTPTTTTDVITTLQNNGLTEYQSSDANLFNTGERITIDANAQSIIDELSSIPSDQLAFVGPASGIGSIAATQAANVISRAMATPAGQEALRSAAALDVKVRNALIGLFGVAEVTSFIGYDLLTQKPTTTTTNSDLVTQIPTTGNVTFTPTTAVQATTATVKPTTQVSTAPTTYVVQPGDYTDTTEVVQPWQSINPTTQVAQPDASRLASMLGVNVDTAANLLRIYPSLFGDDESFTPADLETMTSTDIRLLESGGGGADDNIVIQKPSNDTIVARDSEGQPITYGDLVNIIGSNKITTQPTVQTTTTPTTQVTTQVTTTPTTGTTTRVTPTTEVTTETTPTTEVITETTPTTETTTKPTTATQTTVEPTTATQTTTKPTTATQTTVEPTTSTQTTTKPTTATQTTTKPTTATQTTTTPTAATQTTTTPTTATQTTTKPTIATQTTTTPTTATQTTTTPTTATQTTTTPTTGTQTTTTPTTATQTTTTPTTATQTTVTPTTATQTTVEPTTGTQTTTTPTPTATVTQTPTVTATPTTTLKPTVTPTTSTTTPNVSMPQAQSIAAALGIPALANVFYYGKEFGSKKQKLNEKGELVDEEYKPLSVTKAGAEGELMEEIAEEKKTKENNTNDALDLVLGKSSESMSFEDLLNIVKGA